MDLLVLQNSSNYNHTIDFGKIMANNDANDE